MNIRTHIISVSSVMGDFIIWDTLFQSEYAMFALSEFCIAETGSCYEIKKFGNNCARTTMTGRQGGGDVMKNIESF